MTVQPRSQSSPTRPLERENGEEGRVKENPGKER